MDHKGLVIRNTGSWYTVKADDGGQLFDCKIKGNFRLKGIRSTNPIAVGDRVSISVQPGGAAFITAIEDRRNYIIRKSINLSKQSHIIAANVDQAFLVVTVAHPETSTTFIDRFLASAEAYRIPVVLLFNKTDLMDNDELLQQQQLVALYKSIGYQCLQLSATTGMGIDGLRLLLTGKVNVFSGNSGVGKSTILNHFVTDRVLKTAEISAAHDSGMHTTTFSEMFPLSSHSSDSAAPGQTDGYLIDTPGIKGFGTFDMEPEEICGYFKEIFKVSADCRFNNCTHTHEPGCAVLQAVERGDIALSRYASYLSMLDDKDEDRYRAAY